MDVVRLMFTPVLLLSWEGSWPYCRTELFLQFIPFEEVRDGKQKHLLMYFTKLRTLFFFQISSALSIRFTCSKNLDQSTPWCTDPVLATEAAHWLKGLICTCLHSLLSGREMYLLWKKKKGKKICQWSLNMFKVLNTKCGKVKKPHSEQLVHLANSASN